MLYLLRHFAQKWFLIICDKPLGERWAIPPHPHAFESSQVFFGGIRSDKAEADSVIISIHQAKHVVQDVGYGAGIQA